MNYMIIKDGRVISVTSSRKRSLLYLRKSFSLTTASAYQVLNVRMKYTGGVAVYRNGILVGLFNMKRDFDSETESLTRHDPSSFSKFHMLLNIPNKIARTM